MKRICILIFLITILISGCARVPKEVIIVEPISKEELEKEKLFNEAKNYIDTMKDDSDIYWGEGIANIGEDLGEAKLLAKDRALKELSRQIEVTVKIDITKTLTGSSVSTGEEYSEKIEDEISKKIKIYTNQIITDTKEKFFTDFPKTGTMTYFVYISKKDYEEKVQRDLATKKAMIRTGIQNGNTELMNHNYLNAIGNWIKAKEYTNNFFGQLPLQDDLDNNGIPKEINAYLYGKLNNFFGNTSLTCLYDEIFYDAQGELIQKPVILAQYISDIGERHPLEKLPLKAEFIQGTGIIQGNMQSETYGQAVLPISQVDPTYKITSIHIEIDKQRIPGIDLFSLPPMPSTLIELKKIKTIALSISFFNDEEMIEPDDLKNTVKSILLNSGLSVLSVLITGNYVNQDDIKAVNTTNADYLLFINARTGTSSTVGGYDNMFTTTCSGVISVHKLPQGNMISSENIDVSKGFGVSTKIAGWEAFGKLKDEILSKTKSIIGRM